ncbi:unnamed protein product [Periconia digitata]|uniref:LysM domain-containing protein n=1 Tax=Periconia digitata TaxID=1303443 RepID=A0A9W4XQ18_9PLEO|nr:unnamed protein product [Periconia digitata]
MIAVKLLFAASNILVSAYATASDADSPNVRSLNSRAPAYKIYGGDGTAGQGWPTEAQWLDYDSLWAANYEVMMNKLDETGCLNAWGPNTEAEVAVIKSGIEAAASTSGLDHRFILATMMQESNGCVRVPTSISPNEQVRNPGLFQCANGDHTCNEDGNLKIPCPDDQITGMINDGVLGTASGPGLQQLVVESGAQDVSKYYKALVLYNSGVLPPSGNLGQGRSTRCYASDLANRLTGWTGIGRTCDPNTIGDNWGTPIGEKFEGAPANCIRWYTVQSGDGCRSIEEANGIALGTIKNLNQGVDSNCGNLRRNVNYCLATSD